MNQANISTNSAPERPNFFALLGLPVDQPWSEETFNRALREKRNEWSRLQSNIGQKALLAKRNLAYIPEIELVMRDPQRRKAEAEQARILFAQQRQLRIEDFEKQLAFLNAKDALEEKELEQFVHDFQDVYNRSLIVERIKPTVRATPTSKGAARQTLQASLAKSIQDLLGVIGKASLYDLLELPAATGSQELERAAQALYQREVQRLPKTHEVTARIELAGHAKNIFSSETMRQQYDETLRLASLERLLAGLEVIMSRVSNKELQAGQVRLFLEDARRAGWSQDEAYTLLVERAQQRKWFLAPTEVESRTRCPRCSTLNSRERRRCAQCGLSLAIDCPNCGEAVPAEERICDHCGFEVGNRILVEQRLQEVGKLLAQKQIEEARQLLQELTAIWHPQRPDPLAERIQSQTNEVERFIQNRESEEKAVENQLISLITTRQLIAASQFLNNHQSQIANAGGHRNAIMQNIRAAEIKRRNLEQQKDHLNPDDHIARYREIVDLCKDLPGLDLLRIAPQPPTDLQASLQGIQVNLNWQPSTTANVFYTVVCKRQSPPGGPADGQVLATNLTVCAYQDDSVEVGVPLFYAVYSGYSDALSSTGATLARPVLITQEVHNLQASTDEQLVNLRWDVPPNVYSVLVVRNEQMPPGSQTDGTHLGEYRPPQNHLSDRQVTNGQTYYYALYCQFQDHDGTLILSAGEHVSARPIVPPQPVQRLEITSKPLDGGTFEVILRWDPPATGTVAVLKTQQELSLPVGKELPESELILHGEKLGPQPDQITDRWSKAGVAWYTPVLLFQGKAYPGPSQRFVCVENLRDLEIRNLGDRLQFSWTWPRDCHEVVIAYSGEKWPEDDPSAVKERISRARYERMGGHHYIQSMSDQEYYISVTAMVTVEQTKIAAPAFSRQVRQRSLLEIKYYIKPPDMLHRTPTLYIETNQITTLPTLLLVGRKDRLPLKRDDGTVIKTIKDERRSSLKFKVPLPGGHDAPGTFAKLFLEDDDKTDWVRINTPAKERLRLR